MSNLTLEDHATGQRTLVKHYDRGIDVGWSPDGHAFFLNDAYGSNVESAYIYPLGAPAPLLLDGLIYKADPKARNAPADHTYIHIHRWVSPSTVLAEYCGHNSMSPYRQFDFLYRVALTADDTQVLSIRRISMKTWPADPHQAECTR